MYKICKNCRTRFERKDESDWIWKVKEHCSHQCRCDHANKRHSEKRKEKFING